MSPGRSAFVYWTSAELLEMAVPYLVEGLKAGEKAVYVAHDHPVDFVQAALPQPGVAVLSAKDALYPNGHFDPAEALARFVALAEGQERVRVLIEMTYLLADVPGMRRGAELANAQIFAEYPFTCVCAVNGNLDVGGVLADVLRLHPVLLSRGIPLVNPWYRPSARPARRSA
jgi:hypothetical protein